ncbi:hypothetical protein ACH4A7_23335 [Streptomyces cyaneofuscatus]|uniref:hypothetical protein n=1 Tax=Streptomyces TaxID=1883 RepID=UPI00379DCFEA
MVAQAPVSGERVNEEPSAASALVVGTGRGEASSGDDVEDGDHGEFGDDREPGEAGSVLDDGDTTGLEAGAGLGDDRETVREVVADAGSVIPADNTGDGHRPLACLYEAPFVQAGFSARACTLLAWARASDLAPS